MISNYSGFKGQHKTTVAFVEILGPMGIRVGREERQMFLPFSAAKNNAFGFRKKKCHDNRSPEREQAR